MARYKIKWKIPLFCVIFCICVDGLPVIDVESEILPETALVAEDLLIVNGNYVGSVDVQSDVTEENDQTITTIHPEENEENFNLTITTLGFNHTHTAAMMRNEPVRPGQTVRDYQIEITPNGNTFSGRAIITVQLDADTRDDDIMFHVEDINIQSVSYGIVTLANPAAADFWVDDGLLGIEAPVSATSYIFLIEYTGAITESGSGLHQGSFANAGYTSMNLHPTHARRVFPCMDEPTQESIITFTFNNLGHTQLASNSLIAESSVTSVQFTSLQGPPHRWGMLAHSYVNINNPVIGARLFVRSGVNSQDSQASIIINAVYTRLEEWTRRPLLEIEQNQNDVINIVALPDVSRDWYALSNVPIWEPYILMPTTHAVMQRKTAIIKIAEALARQWFGSVIFPENWRYQWVIEGLVSHAAFEAARAFQGQSLETDTSAIDINVIFVSEVIQEALYHDGYSSAQPLELDEDIYNEDLIRDHIYGVMKYKAPAVMWMVKSLLGTTAADPDVDFVQSAARNLLVSRSLQTFNLLNFYDAINSEYLSAPNKLIEEVDEFFEPWLMNPNYPVVNVQMRTSGVIITQERFAFSTSNQIVYQIPITFTTSVNPNFDNTSPQAVLENNLIIDLFLDEADWVLGNIQGQGYYRVNYDTELWERIIEALSDPVTREIIHPLNRATLVDDSLNLARAGKLDYDIAFRVVLTMEHETHYAVWKAFIRNMDFIRKRLEAAVLEDEDLDPDIYLRMVRRTIGAVENTLGFYPDVLLIEGTLATMTRAIVMEHACKANYGPCIAAAVDWFFDPSSTERVVNPNIPADIRPAVYCTMMRDGDDTVRQALWTQFDAETSMYERLVIVKALGCSQDEGYITGLLQDTVSGGDRFTVEERNAFFTSVVESSVSNADLALRFLRLNADGIRNRYGGPERLEEIIKVVGDNTATFFMAETFENWVNSINSGLDDSYESAFRTTQRFNEDLNWLMIHMDYVYEWIDENGANPIAVSLTLLVSTIAITWYNL